jgi:site-specific DNA-cytosine methylase
LKSTNGKSGPGADGAAGGQLVVANALTTHEQNRHGADFGTLIPVVYAIRSDATTRSGEARTPSMDAAGYVRLRDPGLGISENLAPTLDTRGAHAIAITSRDEEPVRPDETMGDYYERTDAPIPFDTAQITHPENRARPESGDPSPTLSKTGSSAVAFNIYPVTGQGSDLEAQETEIAAALSSTSLASKAERGTRIVARSKVRRLTPRECERLQGHVDNYTAIEIDGKPAADRPRYAALGNGIATNVLAWIGRRIEAVDALQD